MIGNIWYEALRLYVRLGLRIFYRKIEIEGRENLPKEKPIVFAVNHQNSFMDALMVVCFTTIKINFLVRADVFRHALSRFIFGTFKMMPVYRVRDGIRSVDKNNNVFEKCRQYLERGESVLIFPEGGHDLKRQLRKLGKGLARIALGTEMKNNFRLGLQIQPVGLTYSAHTKFRGSVKVKFSKPIAVSRYLEQYSVNSQKTIRDLTEDVATSLRQCIVQIDDNDAYNEVDRILFADNRLLHTQSIAALNDLAIKLNQESFRASYESDTISHRKRSPSFFLRIVNMLHLPVWALNKIIIPCIKDPAFHSSIKLVIGLFATPLYYAVLIWFLLVII